PPKTRSRVAIAVLLVETSAAEISSRKPCGPDKSPSGCAASRLTDDGAPSTICLMGCNRRICLLTFAMAVAAACSSLAAQQPQPAWRPEKLEAPGLPNAYRLHERVISGGEPAGEEAFATLQKLGVKTIISVDGAQPQLELAKRFGLRYVHLPHGYDGVPEGRAKELAKAVRDLPGPIYIHCHHGKHRSPAAATVACVAAGLLVPEQSLTVLTTAGTSDS